MKIMLRWKFLFIIFFFLTQAYTIAIAQTSTACLPDFEVVYFQSCNNQPVSFPTMYDNTVKLRHGDQVCGSRHEAAQGNVPVYIIMTSSTDAFFDISNSFTRSPNPAYLNSCVDYEAVFSEEASEPSGTDALFSGLLVLSPLLLCLGSSGSGGGIIIIIIIIIVKK